MSEHAPQRKLGIKILIVAIPVWLAVSGGVGLWLHFRQQEKERQEQKHAYRKDINQKSLADDFAKITRQIGARHHATETSREALLRMAAMIEGAMGPNNIGYEVKRLAGKEQSGITAPLLVADVLRRKTRDEIWLIVPYDSPREMPVGQASASAVAVSFAVAQSLVGQPLERNVRFLFVPMVYADAQDQLDTAAQVQRLIAVQGAPRLVLVLGSMLHEGKLQLCSSTAAADDLLTGLTEVAAIRAQNDDAFSSLLSEKNLPAVLLQKRPNAEMTREQEDQMPAGSEIMANAAEDVARLLRHLASDPQKK
jgi:hypothetical protein